MSDHLAHLARRTARDPFFLGWSLARYQARTGVCETVLAAELMMDVAALDRLRLCRRPDPTSPHYADELTQIAVVIGCDATSLRRIAVSVMRSPRVATFSHRRRRADPPFRPQG